MAFDPVKDLPDLTGKVAIVTGSTSGIGLATAAVLLRKGAKVYFTARNEEKAKACIKRLEEEGLPGLGPVKGKALFHHLDLADPRGAKKSAEEFLEKEERLDILVNNAAMLIEEYKLGFEGVQEIMITNHFSPFIFTAKLLPLLKKTETELRSDVRIVNVSSDAIMFVPDGLHFKTKEDFNVEFKGKILSSFIRYGTRKWDLNRTYIEFHLLSGTSKLLNLLWSEELQRRLEAEGSNIIVIAVHPGAIRTENTYPGTKRLPWPISWIFLVFAWLVMKPPLHGAATLTIAAAGTQVRAEAEKYKGAFLVPVAKIGKPTKAGEDKELAKELWNTTESLLKEWGLL